MTQPPTSGYQPAAGYPAYAYPPARQHNGMAIASLVVSCLGVLGLCGYGLGGFLGAIGAVLGHVARRQIRDSGDNGDGLALAGIIVGWVTTALFVIAVVLIGIFVWYVINNPEQFESTTTSFLRLLMSRVCLTV